tara:strand:+ start:509 stop:1060 length:552 start_codon:yes stop_codon:yes gene_type:complete
MIRTEIFASPIWEGNIKLNDKLLLKLFNQAINSNYIADNKSSTNGSIQTKDIAIAKEFSDSAKRIENFYYEETNNKVKLGNAWICKNIKGSFNKIHLHGGSDISGVYYLEVPKNSGDIVFRNPNDCVQMADWNMGKDILWTPEYIWKAQKGLIIYFPSYLPHYTQVNQSHEPRLALSFNMRYI